MRHCFAADKKITRLFYQRNAVKKRQPDFTAGCLFLFFYTVILISASVSSLLASSRGYTYAVKNSSVC